MEFLRKSIIWLYHLLFLLVPLVFTIRTDELFEFNKMIMVYAFSVIIGALWITYATYTKQPFWKKTRLDLFLGIFLLSQIVSMLFSMHPRTSWLGYYSRFNGGLYSLLSYSLLYLVSIAVFTKDELKKLLFTVIYSASVTALYALPEHFGHSPSCVLMGGPFDVSCWVQDVKNRVFGTIGQPNWLAAFFVAVLPLSIQWIAENIRQKKLPIASTAMFSLIFSVLMFTKSRSGILAFVAACAVMFSFMFVFSKEKKVITKTATLSGLAFLIIFLITGRQILGNMLQAAASVTGIPLPSFSQNAASPPEKPAAGTQLESGGTESGVIRKIVWKGAISVWKRYPLFGSGVETFAYSYYKDRPIEHNNVSEWDFLYNKAHNEFLNYLATTGAFGLGSYVLFILSVFVYAIKKLKTIEDQNKDLIFALLGSFAGIHVSNFFGFSTVLINLMLFLIPAWLVLLLNEQKQAHENKKQELNFWGYTTLTFVVIFGYIFLSGMWNYWAADTNFAIAKRILNLGQTQNSTQYFEQAILLSPKEASFHDAYSTALADLALQTAQQGDATTSAQIAKESVKHSQEALNLNPVHTPFYKSAVRNIIKLSLIKQDSLNRAIELLDRAKTLSPTDPGLEYYSGVIYEELEDTPKAIDAFQKTLQLKSDYPGAKEELEKIQK